VCGIAGIWQRDGAPVDARVITAMVDELIHRGPDGVGLFMDGSGIALGHRRLKIIDLSTQAAQPIWLPDRSLCMVYNGEVHNYLELAAELRALGAGLRAENDTEVLLWAYRIWGEACFERLNGMWAVAFWEPGVRRLLLSRDRFGIKPLLYSLRGTRIAFASEAKALLAAFPQERRPDRFRLREFISGRLWDPDADEGTFFENIRSLPAGALMCIEETSETKRQHWNFRPGTEIARSDAPEAFLEILRDAVKIRLRSDAPYGVLLSGGLDSSTVARLAVTETPSRLQCISLRYVSRKFDESSYASLVADDPQRYEMQWVTPSADNMLATMAAIVWHHDAPTPIRGRYPLWHVMRAASQFVTVVLGGQGADELLGGYERFVLPFLLDRLSPQLSYGHSRWALIAELFQLGQVSAGIHRVLPPLVFAALARRLPGLRHRHNSGGSAAEQTDSEVVPQTRPFRSRLNNALWHQLRTGGLPEILHSDDALSMAFSLESRLPFLDHRVVEFCFSLRYDEKIGDGWTKLLLRRATPGILPEPVRLRRHKLGTPGDYGGWMGTGRGLEAIRELLLDPATLARGWLDAASIRRCLGGSRRSAERWVRRNPQQTWRMATVELWCRQFLDNDHGLRPAATARVRSAPRASREELSLSVGT
jgi:asparagine synthase (glutamine-hydrolysing)